MMSPILCSWDLKMKGWLSGLCPFQQYLSHLMTKPTKWPLRTAKTQIRLGKCAGWSESSLGAQSLCWFCSYQYHHHHHHHIHFRVLFSSTKGWAFWQVFLKGVLSTQNDSEGQQNPYLASFCHSQALHPMISLACQIFSVQPHSACVHLQSSLCCALHVQTISSYWCGAPHLSPGCQALWEGSLS